METLIDVDTLKVRTLANGVEAGPAVALVPTLDHHADAIGPTVHLPAVVLLTLQRADRAGHGVPHDALVVVVDDEVPGGKVSHRSSALLKTTVPLYGLLNRVDNWWSSRPLHLVAVTTLCRDEPWLRVGELLSVVLHLDLGSLWD